MQVFEDARNTRRQIVIEQDRARIEVLQTKPALRTLERFEHDLLPVGERDRDGPVDRFVERAESHVQTGLTHDHREPRDVLEIERVARMPLGNHEQVLRVRADFLDRSHRCLDGERQHLVRQDIERARKQVRIDRRELEARVAQIDRAVERGGMLLPFKAEPTFDRRRRIEDLPLEIEQRTV